jgi:molecular chaperone DnaK (HSP70)
VTNEPLTGEILRGKATQIALPADAVAAVREIAGLVQEAWKYNESQKTERAEIEAKRVTAVRSIKASERTIRTYLENTFAERRDAIQTLFAGIDTALANGDNEALRTMVGGVIDLARQSPIGPEIRDLTATFGDPMHVWEI